jgi:hypothetical protein
VSDLQVKNKIIGVNKMIKSVLVGLVSLNLFTGGNVQGENNPTQKIVNEHGFQVVQDGNPYDNVSTILATVTNEKDYLGYSKTVNVFDKKDEVYIYDVGLYAGEQILITFKNDDVVKVEKNYLNFGGK